MHSFGRRSIEQIETLDIRLQATLILAIKLTMIDFTVTEGYRDAATQEKKFREGTSKLRFPNSFHNIKPSLAFDIAALVPPKGEVTFEHKYYYYLHGIFTCAYKEINRSMKNISPFILTWGGAWDNGSDFNSPKQFADLCHWQLTEVNK